MALATNSPIFLPASKLGFFDDLEAFKEIYGLKGKGHYMNPKKRRQEILALSLNGDFSFCS